MAKGSVRKKGKKWYYRFYIEDESGNRVQKEFPGTESKSETEALLRKAMEDYEEKKFVAKTENVTVGMLLDQWVEEELKPGNLSNGTVMAYQGKVMAAGFLCDRYDFILARVRSAKPDIVLDGVLKEIHILKYDGEIL